MASIRARQLEEMLGRAGAGIHAVHVRNDVFANTSLLRAYPEIVARYVPLFRTYLVSAPIPNVWPTLEVLGLIAEHAPSAREAIAAHLGPVLLEYATEPGEYSAAARSLLDKLDMPVGGLHGDLKALARSLMQLGEQAIFVVGAGFSYDVMPITNELASLLTTFLLRIGVQDPATVIRDEPALWKLVKEHKETFCALFAGRCAAVTPAAQHRILAELIHDGRVSHTVSFNWDNLIERAYFEHYATPLLKITSETTLPTSAALWKLHGDVDAPGTDWVFPYESGRVFDGLIRSLEHSFQQRAPSHAIIVGYRELEPVVKERLIGWLERHIPSIIRIRPDWTEGANGGHAETARRFLEKLQMVCGSLARAA
jgi:hypothetical protein